MLPYQRNQPSSPQRKLPPKPFHSARNISSICLVILLIANLVIQTGHSSVSCTMTIDGKTFSCNGNLPAGTCASSAFFMTKTSNSVGLEVDCPWSSTVSGVTYLSYLLTLITCILFLPKVNIKSPTFLLVSGILTTILLVTGCALMIADVVQGHKNYTQRNLKTYTYSQTWYIITSIIVGIITLAALGQAILGYKIYAVTKKGGTGAVVTTGGVGVGVGGVTIGGSDKNAKDRYMRMN